MKLRDAIAAIPGFGGLATPQQQERAAAPAVPFTPIGSQNYGPGIGNQPSAEVLLRESTGPFDSASRAIANRLSELELVVKVRRRTEDGTVEDEELDDHPLKKLLDRPHPSLSRAQLLFLAARHILATGECYWQKVGSRLRVLELHPMPPKSIEPLVDRGVIIGYLVTDAHGRQRKMPSDIVVRCFFPDPENPWGAEGYLSPSGIEADAHKFAEQHLRHHYQNDATPKGVIETKGDEAGEWTADSRSRFERQWEQRYSSRSGTVHAPTILPKGYGYTPIKADTREGVTPLLEYWRDNLLMATATPRSVLGQVVSGDRSSAEVNQWVFDRYAVSPIANLIANGLTLQLAPDFDASLIVCFENFVGEDKEFELKREAHDIEHGIRVPNKVLTDRGDDTVKWGEQPLISNTLKPYDPEAELEKMKNPPVPPGGTAPEEDDVDDEEAERREGREHAAIRAKWRARKKQRRAA